MIPKEQLKELFDYDADGWLIRRKSGARVKCSSTAQHRYLRVSVNGRPEYLHRIIYAWHHGNDFVAVDHIDGDRMNNRIENLRSSTQQQNCFNRKKHSTGKNLYKNVYLVKPQNPNLKQTWTVSVMSFGKRKYLGLYDDLDLAELVAIEARNKFHGAFARHF